MYTLYIPPDLNRVSRLNLSEFAILDETKIKTTYNLLSGIPKWPKTVVMDDSLDYHLVSPAFDNRLLLLHNYFHTSILL